MLSLQKVIRPSFITFHSNGINFFYLPSFIALSVTSIIVLPFHTLRRGSSLFFLPKCFYPCLKDWITINLFESCLIIPNSLGKCYFTLIHFFLKQLISYIFGKVSSIILYYWPIPYCWGDWYPCFLSKYYSIILCWGWLCLLPCNVLLYPSSFLNLGIDCSLFENFFYHPALFHHSMLLGKFHSTFIRSLGFIFIHLFKIFLVSSISLPLQTLEKCHSTTHSFLKGLTSLYFWKVSSIILHRSINPCF